jgi:hypothetical protein
MTKLKNPRDDQTVKRVEIWGSCPICGVPYEWFRVGDGAPFPVCHACRQAPMVWWTPMDGLKIN